MAKHPAQQKVQTQSRVKRTLGGITRRVGPTQAKRKHGGK